MKNMEFLFKNAKKKVNFRFVHSFFLFTILSGIWNCSEYFGRKPPEVDYELIELILQYSGGQGSTGCGKFSVTPIRGGPDALNIPTNGTFQGFGVSTCQSDSQILSMGFTPNNLQYTGNGVKGSAINSRLGSQIDFVTLGGRKDQTIEVSFQLDSAGGYLDVIGNASVGSGGSATGPGFRITPERIQAFGTSGDLSGFPVGAPPTTPVGSRVTYCLEIHDEGTAHLFGWSKPCSSLTQADRQNYEFDHKNVPGQNPGNRVGFVLNSATIYQFSIGERIGLSGNILWTDKHRF